MIEFRDRLFDNTGSFIPSRKTITQSFGKFYMYA